MASMLYGVRDFAQQHPVGAVAALLVALPGSYLLIANKSLSSALVDLYDNDAPSSHPSAMSASMDHPMHESVLPLEARFGLPIPSWTRKPSRPLLTRYFQDGCRSIVSLITAAGEQLDIDIDVESMQHFLSAHWAQDFSYSRCLTVAAMTSLPHIAFHILFERMSKPWLPSIIANALQFLVLYCITGQQISIQDFLVAAGVMTTFAAIRRSTAGRKPDTKRIHSHESIALASTDSKALSSPHTSVSTAVESGRQGDSPKHGSVEVWGAAAPRKTMNAEEVDVARLKNTLPLVKSSNILEDDEVKRPQNDRLNARDALAESIAKHENFHDEMRTVKQNVERDLQAQIFKKDIEMFALRQANKHKEGLIREREAKLIEMARQYELDIDLERKKSASLANRIECFEQLDTAAKEDLADSAVDSDSQQSAVQVKLLRIRGRKSMEQDRTSEDKDREIARLREDLAAISTGSGTLDRAQQELRRAWDATADLQHELCEERKVHAQTRNKLREAVLRLEEELRKSQKSSPIRLPTIEESDKHELEAMFNAAQQDNLRLYSEHEVLEKRLREANSKLFAGEQELNGLREKLHLEQVLHEEMESVRPSIVHRAHFHRMEGQLKSTQSALEAKDIQIHQLKDDLCKKDEYAAQLKRDKAASEQSQARAQAENKSLKLTISQLEATKEQLMLDHERLAQHRSRQAPISSDNGSGPTVARNSSARSSGATLITEPILQDPAASVPTRSSTVPTPTTTPRTPDRQISTARSPPEPSSSTARVSVLSTDAMSASTHTDSDGPPTRRKSLTLKTLMRKMTRKDTGPDHAKESTESSPPRIALAPKDKNARLRPKTATLKKEKKDSTTRPKTSGGDLSISPSPIKISRTVAETSRPKTAGLPKAVNAEKPKSSATLPLNGAAVGAKNANTRSERPKTGDWGPLRSKLAKEEIP